MTDRRAVYTRAVKAEQTKAIEERGHMKRANDAREARYCLSI